MKHIFYLLLLLSSVHVAHATQPAGDCDAAFTFTVDGMAVTFTDVSEPGVGPILEWLWDFGDGTTSTEANPVHVYAEPGEYDVCLTIHADGGCWSDDCESNIPVGPAGDCMVSAELAALDGTTAQFIAAVDPTPDEVTYTWIFGDGTTFTETTAGTPSDPIHEYPEPGIYEVCVIIETAGGCVDEFCFEINIPGAGDCMSDFEFTVSGFAAIFTETATATDDILVYAWNFGDGTTGTGAVVDHEFPEPGVYVVCLTIETATCSDTYCMEVIIAGGDPDCHADFEFDAAGLEVHFFETADGGDSDIVSYFWTFGDGTTSTDPNPVHVYAEGDTYAVCLTITTADGCTDTYCFEVSVDEETGPCEAYFVIESIELTPDGYIVLLDNNSGAAADIVTTTWYYGDGSIGDSYDGEHIYTESGTYVICLVIATADGCVDEYCMSITLGEGDDCDADFDEEVSGFNAFFADDSDAGGAEIVSYQWSFGDGTFADGPEAEHTYDSPGEYEVCLTITTSDGCVSTECDVITIEGEEPECFAGFEVEGISETGGGWLAEFNNTSSGSEVYGWSFGDGGSSTATNPEHIYDEAGVYVVCLTVGVAGTDCFDVYCTELYIGGVDECVSEEMIDSTFACTEEYDPVCGCDGVTYGNACYAQYYGGVVYWTAGACDDTGIQEETIIGSLVIAPNPAQYTATVSFTLRQAEEVTVWLMNHVGQQVSAPVQHTAVAGKYRVQLDIADLPSGIYHVQVQTSGSLSSSKMVISK